jgi:putative hydrolase of the HAD superfamily
VLALDAMGVIYQAIDDVDELLVPFLSKHIEVNHSHMESLYHQCSLGMFSSSFFWQQLGLSPDVEDDYLSNHQLVSGVKEFIMWARNHFDSVWCLSNDVSEWSIKLREMFELKSLFDGTVISGDVNARKPSPEIYEALCNASNSRPEDIFFIDDRPENVLAAIECGMKSIVFGKQPNPVEGLPHVNDYAELKNMIQESAEQVAEVD